MAILGGMNIDPADVEHVVALVGRDLTASLGFPIEMAEGIARREALNVAEVMNEWDEDDASVSLFVTRVVEDTQQWLHDTFIDTTWPTCPEHGNHPLWVDGKEIPGWACASSNRLACHVGELGTVISADDATAAQNVGRLEANAAQDAAMLARLQGPRRPGWWSRRRS